MRSRKIKLFSTLLILKLFWGLPQLLGEELSETLSKKRKGFNFDNKLTSHFFDPKDQASEFEHVAIYKKQLSEGIQLKKNCENNPRLTYFNLGQRYKVLHSFLSTFQYHALKLVAKYIYLYANYFDFTDESKEKLKVGLVDNYCSKNITSASLKNIKKFFIDDKNLKLPHMPGQFLEKKDKHLEDRDREKEFIITVNIFKSLCLWNNELADYNTLLPFVRNPYIFSHIVNIFAGKKIQWNGELNDAVLKVDWKEKRFNCIDRMCRPIHDEQIFLASIPLSSGSKSLKDDMNVLYCEEFNRKKRYVELYSSKLEHKVMASKKEFDFQLETAQMWALISGMPDFFVRNPKSDIQSLMLQPAKTILADWAKKALAQKEIKLHYEESITVEELYRDKADVFEPELPYQVDLGINWGELDRATQRKGKLKVIFDLHLPHSFVLWLKNELLERDPRDKRKVENLKRVLKYHLYDQLQKLNSKFAINIWGDKLFELLGNSLLRQFERRHVGYMGGKSVRRIPIRFYFGIYALKYLNYRYRLKKGGQAITL